MTALASERTETYDTHELRREREFYAVNAEKKSKFFRKFGVTILEGLGANPERRSQEWQRMRVDQITEASERLNGAMENVFEYDYHNGDFYFQGQALRPIFIRGIQNTEEIVKHKPEFMVELLRRHIELQQLDEQVELMQNIDWQDPLVLVHISPTPDAVLNDGLDLNAYDTDRKKIMVRITEPTLDGVKVTSLSLDGGDKAALQEVARFFGKEIPDGATSEDILAMHFLAVKSDFDGERPAKIIRQTYDNMMSQQYGGEWYAGRRDSNVLTTMQRILRYPELADLHTDEVWRLKKKFGVNFRFTRDYELATYNYLAAIDESNTKGFAVVDMSGAGSAARANGVQYSNSDCPTGMTISAEKSLMEQGVNPLMKWHYGTCQACFKSGLVGECDICKSCEDADNRGIDLMQIRANALLAKQIKRGKENDTKPSSRVAYTFEMSSKEALNQSVKIVYGEDASIESRTIIGGTKEDIVNAKTGQIIVPNINIKEWQKMILPTTTNNVSMGKTVEKLSMSRA